MIARPRYPYSHDVGTDGTPATTAGSASDTLLTTGAQGSGRNYDRSLPMTDDIAPPVPVWSVKFFSDLRSRMLVASALGPFAFSVTASSHATCEPVHTSRTFSSSILSAVERRPGWWPQSVLAATRPPAPGRAWRCLRPLIARALLQLAQRRSDRSSLDTANSGLHEIVVNLG